MFKRLLVLMAMLLLGLRVVSAQSTLTVFAAASLTDAFTEIEGAFESINLGLVDVVFNFGSSSTLATQIVEGAPGDVFASANNAQMNVVRDAGLLMTTSQTFAKNRLVLIVPVDNPANIQGLDDLDNAGLRLVVAAPDVPVRQYTDTMLERMAADPLYGEAYHSAVLANIVSEEDNVRQVVSKVVLGEADAGIVYVSDVTPDVSSQVIAFPIPDSLNTMATYPVATLTASANLELAQAFVDYLLSDDGQDTLVRWNFISVRIPEVAATITLVDDGAVHVDGQVLNAQALTADDLRANYAAYTIEVIYLSGEDTVTTTFTGALLWDIISTAQPNLNADVRNDKLGMYIVASATDHYQAVIAWGEIDPEFGNQQILVAYDENGEPIGDSGPLRLVVPGDARDGRYVSNLVSLELRDAPQISQ
jgi:molybdate transport system substrate-binding protein